MRTMYHIFLLLLLFTMHSPPCAGEELRSLDGTVYKDARIIGATPLGLDIVYTGENGRETLKGLRFENLPAELGKKYGYDPAAGKEYDDTVKRYADKDFDRIVEDSKTELEKLRKDLRGRNEPFDLVFKNKDFNELIHSRRQAVYGEALDSLPEGTLLKVKEGDRTVVGGEDVILVDGLNLPKGSQWRGFIYPAGVKSMTAYFSAVPVYSVSVERSVAILEKYLNIHGNYAIQGADRKTTEAPPEPAPAASVAGQDQTLNGSYYDPYTAQAAVQTVYYIGSPVPVYWYYNNWWHRYNWHHRRPPCPGPRPHPGPHPGPRPDPQPRPRPCPRSSITTGSGAVISQGGGTIISGGGRTVITSGGSGTVISGGGRTVITSSDGTVISGGGRRPPGLTATESVTPGGRSGGTRGGSGSSGANRR